MKLVIGKKGERRIDYGAVISLFLLCVSSYSLFFAFFDYSLSFDYLLARK